MGRMTCKDYRIAQASMLALSLMLAGCGGGGVNSKIGRAHV